MESREQARCGTGCPAGSRLEDFGSRNPCISALVAFLAVFDGREIAGDHARGGKDHGGACFRKRLAAAEAFFVTGGGIHGLQRLWKDSELAGILRRCRTVGWPFDVSRSGRTAMRSTLEISDSCFLPTVDCHDAVERDGFLQYSDGAKRLIDLRYYAAGGQIFPVLVMRDIRCVAFGESR